jgi:2-oxoisovalerate dehydrogenase E2 component (dihydrolipoyl transacylase)
VPIGAPLCSIETPAGEVPADIAPPQVDGEAVGGQGATSKEQEAPVAAALPATTATAEPAPAPQAVRSADADGNGANRATPRVRKLAAELSVDLAAVTGTGPRGRILEDDVRAAAAGNGAAAPATPTHRAAPKAPPATGDETVQLTAIRKTIAQRMSESALGTPVAWLVVECDVSGLVALRAARKEKFRETHGVDLTYLPFAAHAVCAGLREHPYLNASWADDHIVLRKRINLGVAAATERGLVVPVIHDADRLSVTGLALEMSELGERARAGKLTLDDVQNGTFTLDNTGSFGSIISQPIINLGQAAIISLEAITKRPIVVDSDAIAVRSIVNVCLSFDHRVLDGHQAGAFLKDVKQRMESFTPEAGLE